MATQDEVFKELSRKFLATTSEYIKEEIRIQTHDLRLSSDNDNLKKIKTSWQEASDAFFKFLFTAKN